MQSRKCTPLVAVALLFTVADSTGYAGRPPGASAISSVLDGLEAPDKNRSDEAWRQLAELLNKSQLESAEVIPESARVSRQLRASLDRVTPLQRSQPATCGSFVDAPSYEEPRGDAELLLDLAGFGAVDKVAGELQRAAGLADPRLAYFAVRSQLRLGLVPAPAAIRAIGASDEMRARLFEVLSEAKRVNLMPAEHRTQEALARSVLVHWLVYPTELGCAPNKIKLLKLIRTAESDLFVFAFRTDKPKAKHMQGWLAGVSGPYARSGQPTAKDEGGTFSDFAPADSKSPEEHAARITEMLNEAWKQKARQSSQ